MKRILLLLTFILTTLFAAGQNLYLKTFGSAKHKALIFIHGGPGSNSATFEASTAQKLADNGFYVVLYDRRGEGRSVGLSASYTFQQTFDDLNDIYKIAGLKKANLIGYSFGGILATLYAEKYPEKVKSLILVSSLISMQETYKTILKSSKEIYLNNNDRVGLSNVARAEAMNKGSLEFRDACFKHAAKNNFFTSKRINESAKNLYAAIKDDTLLKKVPDQTGHDALAGFWKNEKHTTIDLTPDLKELLAKKMKIFALYGMNDGLFSEEQVYSLRKMLGADHLRYLDNCSHTLYIDQQPEFLDALKTWAR